MEGGSFLVRAVAERRVVAVTAAAEAEAEAEAEVGRGLVEAEAAAEDRLRVMEGGGAEAV